MDFFKEAQKLADHAKELTQAATQNLNEAVDEAQKAASELATSGMATLDQLSSNSARAAQETTETINGVLDGAKKSTLEIAASGVTTANNLKEQATTITQQRLNALRDTTDQITSTGAGIGAAGLEIANALKDLPRTAEELAREMPKIAHRLRTGAGLRVGDAPRSDADVMKLFEKIPGTSKLEAKELNIRQFLADKHGSHIISRQQGGSNGADNILWEVGTANLQRGSKVMTGGEQIYIRFYNAIDSILKNSTTIAKLGVTATGTAVLTQAVVTAASYALDLYRGDITVEEFRDRVLEAAIAAGIAAPLFFLLLIGILALFPEFAIILSAPAIVAGFNALFGISIAAPIIQSILRHLEAGGFGVEATETYQNLINETQKLLETSTEQMKSLAQEWTTDMKGALPTSGDL